MNEIFDKYELTVLPALAFRTQTDYRRHIAVLRVKWGHRHPDSLEPKEIGAHLDVLKAKVMRNREIAVLSAVYNKAVGRWFVAQRNPCAKVERNDTKPRDRYITDDEFAIIKGFSPARVQIMMDLALLTGQRQGDLLDLKWSDCYDDVRVVPPLR